MPPNRSARAEAAAQEVPLCPPCTTHGGLCIACAPTVLPQLRQASWHRDAHRGENAIVEKLSPEGEKVKRRKARRDANRRLLRALAGEHTRSRAA